MRPHEKLDRYWRETDAGMVVAGASEVAVVALEHKYELSLPTDFRAYLLESSPAEDQVDVQVTECGR